MNEQLNIFGEKIIEKKTKMSEKCEIDFVNDYKIIAPISAKDCGKLLMKYHYLTKKTGSYRGIYNFGIIDKQLKLVGCVMFAGLSAKEAVSGYFGRDNTDQDGLWELTRLCLDPALQRPNENITSQFVAKCIKELKKRKRTDAILSYADDDYHKGIIYQALSFDYYGMTGKHSDPFIKQLDGSYKQWQRGALPPNVEYIIVPRPRKHIYIKTFTKQGVVKGVEKQKYPKKDEQWENEKKCVQEEREKIYDEQDLLGAFK